MRASNIKEIGACIEPLSISDIMLKFWSVCDNTSQRVLDELKFVEIYLPAKCQSVVNCSQVCWMMMIASFYMPTINWDTHQNINMMHV